MDATSSYYLLSRFSKLRKKPQQPLTDLTELYGRIANQSIYYLKLEEQKEYNAALQGWKALNTDVMYQITMLEREYPNTQTYSREEASLNTGVRELYHKSLGHLERLRKICEEESSNKPATKPYVNIPNVKSSRRPDSHSHNGHSSFIRKPISYPISSQGFPTKMATTLRDPKAQARKGYHIPNSYPKNSGASGNSNSSHRVNFAPSKPLGKKSNLPKSYQDDYESEDNLIEEDDEDIVDSMGHFKGFDDDDKMFAHLTSDSDKNSDLHSSNSLDFDPDELYGDDDEDADNAEETEETDDEMRRLDNRITNLSIGSTSNLPATKPTGSSSLSGSPERNGVETGKNAGVNAPVRTQRKSRSPTRNIDLKPNRSTPNLLHKPHSNSPSSSLTHNRPQQAQNAAKKVLSHPQDRPITKKSLPSGNNGTSSLKNPKKPLTKKTTKPVATTANRKPITAGKVPSKRPYGNASHSTSSYSTVQSTTSSFSSSPPTGPPVGGGSSSSKPKSASTDNEGDEDEEEKKRLKEALEDEIIDSLHGVDRAAAKQIFAEIVVHGDEVHWEDIAGLESAKASLKEAVVYPFLRPDLFRGLREPIRGMLLFGPPGTGKTMLARSVATESHSTFFSVSASTLTSKYLGESEKLVRALFAVAKKLSPSIIFVDEIDSIMGSRSNEGENESSRRIKNEFLVQWSSLSSAAAGKQSGSEEDDERVLVLAATNLPWSIDEAARRRFVRRQYIPLPEPETRSVQLSKLLSHQKHTLSEEDFLELVELTDGYSGSDITSLAKDAAMGPLRELGEKLLLTPTENIRSIALKDFKSSLRYIKPSVSQEGLEKYEDWAAQFGSSGA
ncbi:ZYRO0D16346p [Zygosaccharomyces rouxii]|uniref:ZYRO0D16346p n=1 Tax=Zygosaccharomyces rouxii (strain ATCC 2623 / CBS 732 / NBRC 1130 / NCYC 568 / NRRL Y-229) TaxID=559307 RepID=C5DWN9_ZYGRC|nr:uncharacterized protein ZYRO0D16346g [Zygosaccharomyces rouxii]KAH9201118.1 P-loop containing nucleoside triphosphate hydrolase protein [Zygosaccharomyces rouxii]CAR28208.1 ZYRO0D16346p [Zygosaccharomyces rouxii]